jgi:hypothetical protein
MRDLSEKGRSFLVMGHRNRVPITIPSREMVVTTWIVPKNPARDGHYYDLFNMSANFDYARIQIRFGTCRLVN